MSFQSQQLLPYAIPALVAWMFYRRVRGNFGAQAWKPGRVYVRLALVSLVAVMLALAAAFLPHAALPLAAGLAGGAVLGWFGLRHTHAEWRNGVRTYVPNPWIGGLLTLALAGRLVWRYVRDGGFTGAQQQPSVLTMAIAAVLITYTLVYNIGLILRMRELGEHPPQSS